MIKSTERHFGANLLGHCNQCNTNDRNALELVILVQVCLDIRCATNSSVVWTDIIQQRASKHTYTTGMKQLLDLEHVSSSSIRAGLDCLQTILAGCFIFQGANNLKSDFAITLSTCRAREGEREEEERIALVSQHLLVCRTLLYNNDSYQSTIDPDQATRSECVWFPWWIV
jgi:hypothetical protein